MYAPLAQMMVRAYGAKLRERNPLPYGIAEMFVKTGDS